MGAKVVAVAPEGVKAAAAWKTCQSLAMPSQFGVSAALPLNVLPAQAIGAKLPEATGKKVTSGVAKR